MVPEFLNLTILLCFMCSVCFILIQHFIDLIVTMYGFMCSEHKMEHSFLHSYIVGYLLLAQYASVVPCGTPQEGSLILASVDHVNYSVGNMLLIHWCKVFSVTVRSCLQLWSLCTIVYQTSSSYAVRWSMNQGLLMEMDVR